MFNTVYVVTKRTSMRGGRPVESVLHAFACRLSLCGWVTSFYIGSGDWGSGLYGMIEPLPAIEMVARDISRSKLVLFVHVQFKFFCRVVEVVGWESVGLVQDIILSV
eukprot:1161730-Pelagomonas_calceolata.AAC.3